MRVSGQTSHSAGRACQALTPNPSPKGRGGQNRKSLLLLALLLAGVALVAIQTMPLPEAVLRRLAPHTAALCRRGPRSP